MIFICTDLFIQIIFNSRRPTPFFKNAQEYEQTLYQKICTNSQIRHKKILYVISHLGNANLKPKCDTSLHSLEGLKLKLRIPSVVKDVDLLEFSYLAHRYVKWYNHFGEHFVSFL